MELLPRLQKNKGMVSSALSKQLAEKVLAGDKTMLAEAVNLMIYEKEEPGSRHVRSAAGKIVEIVAEARPELVAPMLDKVFPALETGESQTRWMAIRIFGFCAALDRKAARKAVPFAEEFIRRREGLCIKSSADHFLGDLGALSPKDAAMVFPLLLKSVENLVLNEQDWLLVAFGKIIRHLKPGERKKIFDFAGRWAGSSRKTTRQRAAVILKLEREGER